MSHEPAASSSVKTLILITGTGRSGTSTMSGLFYHLGLSVPGPYLGANESNPKGFFESRWAVQFHKRIAERAGIHDFDSRPTALARIREATSTQDRDDLARFLARFPSERHVVVKDPRSVWTQALWREVAAEAGREIRYVSMLRHPAEVIGSRLTYYADQSDEDKRTRYETFNVARWVNGSLINERETRDQPRAFVRYSDLLGDWRAVAQTLDQQWQLGLDFEGSPAVDEFIDPALRRHATTWDDLHVPISLRDIAEPMWTSLETLADRGGVSPEASAVLDEASASYDRIFSESSAMSHDATQEARAEGYAAGVKVGFEEGSSASIDAKASAAEVGGRELVKELGNRGVGRLRAAVRRVRRR